MALGRSEHVHSIHNFLVIEIPSFLNSAMYISVQKCLLLSTEKNMLLTNSIFRL